ncbi:Twitching motility protein PilT [hydrothermal vent metagenome]|uniref:Twitching motility protein PilT n=1 Tax=hydrothermal vent metagenome TaxID=652676 RepID=A0A3B1DQP4_9ZZZZ
MPNQKLPKNFLESTGHGQCAVAIPSTLSLENSLNEIFVFARAQQASDVHLSVNNSIFFRLFGSLKSQTEKMLSFEKMEKIIEALLTPEQLDHFQKIGDLEFVYVIKGAGRFRITVIKQRHGIDLTARLIPCEIPSFEESGIPTSCTNLTKWAQGLILVTGPAGCGKTTTLSILVEMINQTRAEHIITIENPIEIVYTPKQCQITQRQLNKHTLSQANALRAALREDPDILVVSELRDLESIQLAVTAAETGHLVLGTMNTNNASQTISSLIDSFPPDEQAIITNMISESLRGVISQQLVPKQDGTGVAAAYEVLIVNTAVANMIRERKTQLINNAITTGKSAGMVLFDNSLQELVNTGIINGEEAYARSINPNTFAQYSKKQGENIG